MSCWFELRNFDTGEYVEMWNVAATSDGDVRHQFLDVEPGRYYLEADPSSGSYIWAFTVMEQICVEHCS